jgi:hypothetical protein
MRTSLTRILSGVGMLGVVFYGINAIICSNQLDTSCTVMRLGEFKTYAFFCLVVAVICLGVSMITPEEGQDG